MKILIAVLILMLIGLQFKLWFGDGSLSEVVQLTRELEIQRQRLSELEERNKILEAQVLDLQNGLDAFEEKARNDLGMIKQGETFIQLIPQGATTDGQWRVCLGDNPGRWHWESYAKRHRKTVSSLPGKNHHRTLPGSAAYPPLDRWRSCSAA